MAWWRQLLTCIPRFSTSTAGTPGRRGMLVSRLCSRWRWRCDWHLRDLSCRTDSVRNFPISRQKVAHRKTHRKTYRKTHRKTHRETECFHRICPPNFSPNFRCVFFCNKNSKCHRKTASKKFSQKIPSRHTAKSRVPMWQGWEPLNMPI